MVCASRKLITKDSRKYIESEDLISAILRIAADLEHLFFDKLFFEKRIEAELIDRWTLGKYLDWNVKLNLIDKKYESKLREFLRLRNKFVHERMFMEKTKRNKDELIKIKKLLIDLCDFIDLTEVRYADKSLELENKYIKHWEKKN